MMVRRQRRAYALPMVLVLVAVLAAGLSVLLASVRSSSTTSTRLFRRTQAQYAVSGVARAAAIAAGDSLMLKPAAPEPLPEDADARRVAMAQHLETLRNEVNRELVALTAELTPAGFIIEDLRVEQLKERRSGQVQEGSFRGMNAFIQPFDVVVRGRHNSLRDGSFIRVDTSVERLFIPMFQFFAFIDGYAFIFNGPGAKYAGRIHSNGNMCLGSGQPTYLEKITSGGLIYKLRGSGCRNEKSGGIGAQSIFVSRAPLPQGAATYATPGFETGFSLLFAKDADAPDWATAASLWQGQVQDQTHGVPILRAPIRGTPLVQRGRDAVHALRDNTQNSRFLIDPLLPDEPADVRSQKIAFKADLRIVDGVWYLRDESDPVRLGTPIWSDHPGRARVQGDESWGGEHDVGQTDLFGAGARPRRYSYYSTVNDASAALAPPSFSAAERPVLSYGVVHRTVVSGAPLWLPGFMNAAPAAGCTAGAQSAPGMCFATHAAATAAQVLQGTRGGLRSAWDESGVAPGAEDCGVNRETSLGLGDVDAGRLPLFNMLPVNIDLLALQAALTDRNPGELGSHFVNREFNGVVWVSSTWPGYRDGFGSQATATAGRHWPFQGQQDDPFSGDEAGPPADKQPDDGLPSAQRSRLARYDGYPNFNPAVGATRANPPFQRALPQPLCTDTDFGSLAGKTLASYKGASTFGAGSDRRFLAPSCARYTAGELNARPNAVRIINGSTLSRAALPDGLSVVTNLPMFILGDLNTSSVPADRPADRNASWVPLMVGGDTIGLLSSAWTDDEAPWNTPVGSYWYLRDAASTRYHGAFLYGWAEAALGATLGCREELSYSMRLHEHWHRGSGRPFDRIVRGSIFVGWNSVWSTAFSNVHEADQSGAWHDGDGATKIYSYDHHLDLVQNQPPGAPQFQLTNVLRHFAN